MTWELVVTIIVAAISGGGLAKLIELLSGKSLRDELRAEMGRLRTTYQEELQSLRTTIKELQTEVDVLKKEAESWKDRVDEWRVRYYNLFEEHQLLKIGAAGKAHLIRAVQIELRQLLGLLPEQMPEETQEQLDTYEHIRGHVRRIEGVIGRDEREKSDV